MENKLNLGFEDYWANLQILGHPELGRMFSDDMSLNNCEVLGFIYLFIGCLFLDPQFYSLDL